MSLDEIKELDLKQQPIPTNEILAPIQPRQWPLDQQLRSESIDCAINIAHHWDKKYVDIKDIIANAQQFYDFLKGDIL